MKKLNNWPFKLNGDGKKVIGMGELLLQYNSGDSPFLEHPNGDPVIQDWYRKFAAGTEFNTLAALALYGHETQFIGRRAHDDRDQPLHTCLRDEAPDVDLRYLKHVKESYDAATPWYALWNGHGPVQAQAVMRRANSPLSHITKQIVRDGILADVKEAAKGASVFVLSTITVGVSSKMPNFIIGHVIPELKKKGVLVALDCSYRSQQYADIGGKETFRKRVQRIAKHVDLIFHNYDYGCDDLGVDPDRYTTDLHKRYPKVKVTLTARRIQTPDGLQRYQNFVWVDGNRLFDLIKFTVPAVHRVGCGDANWGGFIHAMLQDKTPREAGNFGAASGSAQMVTPGDVTCVPEALVLDMVKRGGGAADASR